MHGKLERIIIALGLAGVLATAGCGGGAESAGQGKAASLPAEVGGRPGQRAPEFHLARLEGGELSLSSLQGKVVLVDFWDTWCGPCKKSLPHLEALNAAYGPDLVVVGVALARYGAEDVRAFVAKNGLTMPVVLFNQDVKLLQAFGSDEGIPTTILIDRDGVVRYRWVGGYEKAVYESAVQKVLGV